MKTPDRRALRRIELKNLLSFGPDSPALELENLNILIGPNGSGKSNLIEAISLLRAAPVSVAAPKNTLRGVITLGGGLDEWIFKGSGATGGGILVEVGYVGALVEHFVSFGSLGNVFRLRGERVVVDGTEMYQSGPFVGDGAWITPWEGERRKLDAGTVDPGQSVLSQIRDGAVYPFLGALSHVYEGIRIFKDWTFGRRTVFRDPQPADAPSDRLAEDFSNLGLVLSGLRNIPPVKKEIVDLLRDLYEGVTDFEINTRSGYVDIFFHEGDFAIPAKRLSDGTLRYLCLLAILCDPDPPPLICIEEPELGLHPDILPKLADLLVEASERTQLIVTTHSDVLVDAMTERPEVIVACEKQEGQTHMRRLNRDELAPWLNKYRLGELWNRGGIGANRW